MQKGAIKRKLPMGQISLFLAISLVAAIYVAVNAIGADSVAPKNVYSVLMDDAGGISPHSPVSYRGIIVGEVDDVISRPGDNGVKVTMSVLERVKIPKNTQIAVAQDTPVALKHIDLRPSSDKGPYLADGDTVGPQRTSRPLALEQLLVNLMKLTDSIDIDDVTVIADELGTGLAGTAPHLEKLADNTFAMVDKFVELQPTAKNLIDNSAELLEASGGESGRLVRIAKSLATVSKQIRKATPDGLKLARQVSPLAKRVVPLLRENQPALSVLLANLVTPAQIISARTPALRHGLVVIPEGFRELATIGNGDTANFEFVVTQGGLCYYDNKRRTPQDVAPREPKLTYHCPSKLPIRGAANAPRPGAAEYPVITSADPATGRAALPGGETIRMGSNGGQSSVLGAQSWTAVFLHGITP